MPKMEPGISEEILDEDLEQLEAMELDEAEAVKPHKKRSPIPADPLFDSLEISLILFAVDNWISGYTAYVYGDPNNPKKPGHPNGEPARKMVDMKRLFQKVKALREGKL